MLLLVKLNMKKNILNDGSVSNRFDAVKVSKTFQRICNNFRLGEKKVLDLGCAYGEHLVLFGTGSVGVTVSDEEVDYGIREGLPIVKGNVEYIDTLFTSEKFSTVWANNLFEHLLAPHVFLMKLKEVTEKEGTLLLGVPVVPRIATLMRLRRFRGALSVAHTNFFTRETLRLTVERGGWRVVDTRPFWTTVAPLDRLLGFIAPHLYIVAQNDASFSYDEKKVKEWSDDSRYSELLARGSARPVTLDK